MNTTTIDCTCGFKVTAGTDCMFCGADADLVIDMAEAGAAAGGLPAGVALLH